MLNKIFSDMKTKIINLSSEEKENFFNGINNSEPISENAASWWDEEEYVRQKRIEQLMFGIALQCWNEICDKEDDLDKRAYYFNCYMYQIQDTIQDIGCNSAKILNTAINELTKK